MGKLILLHVAAGVVTTVCYTYTTGDDPTYIMAMVAMYIWCLVTVTSLWETIKDYKQRIRRYTRRRRK